jgi:hypothetical protein
MRMVWKINCYCYSIRYKRWHYKLTLQLLPLWQFGELLTPTVVGRNLMSSDESNFWSGHIVVVCKPFSPCHPNVSNYPGMLSTIDNWRSRCKGWILRPTPYIFIHLGMLSSSTTPTFRFHLGFDVKILLQIRLSSSRRMWRFHCDLDFIILLFRSKIFSSSPVLVDLCSVWSFLV